MYYNYIIYCNKSPHRNLLLPLNSNKLQSPSVITGGDVFPTLFLQIFSECTSVCAFMEEDSRAVLSDILWGNVGGWGGADCTKEVREEQDEWREGDSGSRCRKDSGIVGDLLLLFSVFIPSSFLHLLQVQKGRVDIQQWCEEARQMTDLTQPTSAVTGLCGIFIPPFVCLCVCVCAPLRTRQTGQTFTSQGQTQVPLFQTFL